MAMKENCTKSREKCDYVFEAFKEIYGEDKWNQHVDRYYIFFDLIQDEWATLLKPIPYAVIDRALNIIAESECEYNDIPSDMHFVTICASVAKRPYLIFNDLDFDRKQKRKAELAIIPF